MTEAEWLAASEPQPMLDFLAVKGSNRKLRLFALGCCQEWLGDMQDERSRVAVEIAEKYAEGLVSLAELFAAKRSARSILGLGNADGTDRIKYAAKLAWMVSNQSAYGAASRCSENPFDLTYKKYFRRHRIREMQNLKTRLFRCIFGNPFRPISIDPSWLTSTVLALTTGIYQERAFDRMPILADALQDAGCDNEDILNHLRGQGPHTKGCWVVDLLLDKK